MSCPEKKVKRLIRLIRRFEDFEEVERHGRLLDNLDRRAPSAHRLSPIKLPKCVLSHVNATTKKYPIACVKIMCFNNVRSSFLAGNFDCGSFGSFFGAGLFLGTKHNLKAKINCMLVFLASTFTGLIDFMVSGMICVKMKSSQASQSQDCASAYGWRSHCYKRVKGLKDVCFDLSALI
jgi:hypothetical protein